MSLKWPINGGRITQRFGENPNHPQFRYGPAGHMGLDLGGVPAGSPVFAIADGEVAWVDTNPGYGNYVRIWHPQLRVHSFYAHLEAATCTRGQQVAAGRQIGKVGNTGLSFGAHLHLEIRIAGIDSLYADSGTGHSKGQVDPLTAFHLSDRWLS